MSEHQWHYVPWANLIACKVCGETQRADGQDYPCPGPRHLRTRTTNTSMPESIRNQIEGGGEGRSD